MKKWLLSTLAIGLVTCNVQADELKQPYDKLKKQINIMSSIISTSLSQGQRRSRNRVEVDGFYLKSQGVVFEISANRGSSRFLQLFGDDGDLSFSVNGIEAAIPVMPSAPRAPLVIGDSGDTIVFSADGDISVDTYEDFVEAARDKAEHARELREEQRDLSYEVRNLSRRIRDSEFELRHAEKDRLNDLKQELNELKEQRTKLERKSEELSKRAEQQEKVLKQSRDKRKQKLKQATDAYYAKLDSAIAETLCNYGAGLRKMAKNEYVTFVIDMGSGRNDGPSKKIHSFSKKDINACVIEDKTPEQLLKAAQSYYF